MKPDDALYTAESIVAQRKFPSRLADPQVYIDSILASAWWMNRYPTWGRRGITVVESNHACAWSSREERKMWMPPWACSDFTCLHELSHFPYSPPSEGHHGLFFRRLHLSLVQRFMGQEASSCYRHAMLAMGLEV